ncbi:MAG: hypothetical protein Q8J64_10580 [Thermodesulfovibrionales bacterium]|nr:hypothetical protein [Thermodesulfovibrionales bacterium]
MTEFHAGQVVYHPEFGTGRVVNVEDERIAVDFIRGGLKFFKIQALLSGEQELSDTPFEAAKEEEAEVEIDELKEAIRQVLREEGATGTALIADKWEGGEMILRPGKPGLKEKSVPIENFFHKIVMLRDRLRVLEQNINSSEKLTEAEKINLQSYLTRCYGSLTTFNVLFADKGDWFVGAKKEE